MIAAVYAVGKYREFGLKGKLPWGSFKEELDNFYLTLDNLNPDNIIIGAGTWLALPPAVQAKMVGDAELFIFSERPIEENIGAATQINHIGFKMPAFFLSEDTVVLGGAYLLAEMYTKNHIDLAYVSTVTGVAPFQADVKLHPYILQANEAATRLTYVTGSNAEKGLSFKQELMVY
ncbi:putative dihydrofolate reductase [Yersinia phage phiR2-01]|uniref:Dihydrofolate reductase n=1 Tax=Yersinia phage phiR2-01 TaxID=1206557 RepID=I7LEE8_9CAUD|nr:putative dihydrofolate reductase [Yersinia phage phiR2-01]CCI88512.1 putative dihydrofolate reductase [Yersinia phage phiR2-01]